MLQFFKHIRKENFRVPHLRLPLGKKFTIIKKFEENRRHVVMLRFSNLSQLKSSDDQFRQLIDIEKCFLHDLHEHHLHFFVAFCEIVKHEIRARINNIVRFQIKLIY